MLILTISGGGGGPPLPPPAVARSLTPADSTEGPLWIGSGGVAVPALASPVSLLLVNPAVGFASSVVTHLAVNRCSRSRDGFIGTSGINARAL